METRARLINAFRSFESSKTVLTIEVDSCGELDKLTERDLRLVLKPWRERRSLNANAYFHTIAGKIGEEIGLDLIEVKNRLIAQYGQMERTEAGDLMTVTMLDTIPWERLERMKASWRAS